MRRGRGGSREEGEKGEGITISFGRVFYLLHLSISSMKETLNKN
jgi:hypothetical protein